MELRSLGYRSELIFAEFDGQVQTRDGYTVIRTLTNPNYFWGNLLVFDLPPRVSDVDDWIETFHREFTDPRIYHITLAWDPVMSETGREFGDVSGFVNRGYLLESKEVLALDARVIAKANANGLGSTHEPKNFNKALRVRPLESDDEWERMIQVQVGSSHGHLSRSSWESFYRDQSHRYKAMAKAGLGHWFGGFFEDELVAGLGIFCRERLARFQTVCTDPKFQRRGFCATIVFESMRQILRSHSIDTFVMCADPDYHAIRIYESVGFVRQAQEHGVYWWDKSREPGGEK